MDNTTKSPTRRVDPWGRLSQRQQAGRLMGNRGGALNLARPADRQQWKNTRWISCDPHYKPPGHPEGERVRFKLGYTRLFFLDEATALAAGHRPCHFCRKRAFKAFTRLWAEANLPDTDPMKVSVDTIDRALHAERTRRDGSKPTWAARAQDLPAGAVYTHEGEAYVAAPDGAQRWPWEGGAPTQPHPTQDEVAVLTPRSIVAVLQRGYLNLITQP